MKLDLIRGVVVPLVTPFTDNGDLDHEAIGRLVRHVVDGGAHGIMISGTTGESLALTLPVRCALMEAVTQATAGRVTVVAAIGASCLEDVLALSDCAADVGADALALHPPPYFPFDDHTLRHFYETILDRARLPLALYTIPSFARNPISPSLVDALAGHEKVIALKDSTGDMNYFRQVVEICRRHQVGVLIGDEMLITQGIREGGVGIVPSSGNLRTEEFVQLWDLCVAGKWSDAAKLQAQLNEPVLAALSKGGWLGMMRTLKGSLAEEGICGSHMAEIFSASEEEVAQ